MCKLFLTSVVFLASCSTVDFAGKGSANDGIAASKKRYTDIRKILDSKDNESKKSRELKQYFCKKDVQTKKIEYTLKAYLQSYPGGNLLEDSASGRNFTMRMLRSMADDFFRLRLHTEERGRIEVFQVAPIAGEPCRKIAKEDGVERCKDQPFTNGYGTYAAGVEFGFRGHILSKFPRSDAYRRFEPDCRDADGFLCSAAMSDAGATFVYFAKDDVVLIAPFSYVHKFDRGIPHRNSEPQMDQMDGLVAGPLEAVVLQKYFTFAWPGRKDTLNYIVDSKDAYWGKYFSDFTSTEEVSGQSKDEVTFRVRLSLEDFCKYGVPVADFYTK